MHTFNTLRIDMYIHVRTLYSLHLRVALRSLSFQGENKENKRERVQVKLLPRLCFLLIFHYTLRPSFTFSSHCDSKHSDSPSPFHDKEEPLRKKRLHTSLYKGVDLMYLWESPPTNQLHIYGIHYKSSISTPKQVRSQLFSTPPTPRGEDFSGRLQLKGNEKKEKQQRKARLQSS